MIDRIRNRFGKVGLIVAALVVVAILAGGAALAFILASAQVTGTATGGQVTLAFSTTAPGGTLPVESAEYDVDGTTIVNGSPTLPPGVTASASIVDGKLDMTFDNVFPGDGFLVPLVSLTNDSTLPVNLLQWTYNADSGPDGAALPVNVYIGEWNGAGYDEVDPATFGTIAAEGGITSAFTVIVEFPASSFVADGTAISLDGISIDGEAVR